MERNHNDPLAGHFGVEVEGVLHYNSKPYNLETLQADIMERNHDDPLAGHFGVKKTLELLL